MSYSSVDPIISLFLFTGIKFLPFMLKCFGRDNKLISFSLIEISIACPKTGFNLMLCLFRSINLIASSELQRITASLLTSKLFLHLEIH